MATTPADVVAFLAGRSIAVAGVSRTGQSAANPVFRKLRQAGYDVYPVNPNATEVEGARCYPTLAAIGRPLDGVVVATAPSTSIEIVAQSANLRVGRVWLHRSFGQGSVSDEAVRACRQHGIACIVGGCPLMYCEPVDIGHACMRWILRLRGRLPKDG